MPGVTVQAEAYLQSRLREFEEEDGPIGNGYIGEGDCVEEIILAPSVDDSRQDTDERLRRLQTDKEALAMQVKTLTEQVQTQSSKIIELERTVKEKNQLLSNAEDLLQRTPPATYRQRIDVHYSSLPRQAFATTLSTVSTSSGSSTATDSNANPKRNVAFAETENGNEDRSEGVPTTRSYTPQPSPSPSMSNKLKNIFGKIKRSNSGTLEDLTGADSEFKRGGIRATAGPRLGWSGTAPYRRPDKPFREWNLDTVCQWFDHLGLSMYEEELSRWLKSSTAPAVELMKASPVDIEKELNLRNPLHRKKIVLAVADVSGSEDEDELFKSAGLLDTSWTPKKSQFSLKRKKSAKGGQLGEEWSDFVCPMGGSGQEHLPSASYASTANSTNNSNDSPGAPTAFTSNASSNANTNHVTSIGMTKNPSMVPTAYPDSTTSSSTSTTISGVESEPASLPQQLLNSAPPSMTMQVVSGASGGGCGSDSPLSTRSSTTSTS
uniref:Uncharacterized protein n=1 Tax=Anopheles atroparvus TaxID=41427 RepID=A0A182JI25_ANOAO